MRSKLLLSGLLLSVMAVPALAQQTNTPAGAPTPAANSAATSTPSTMPMGQTSSWRASKLIGVDVYNDRNESLGDINEVLIDRSGKVTGVVIGVGGFLGLGERNIMVSMDKLRFVNEPRSNTTAMNNTTTRNTPPANTAAPSAAPSTTGTASPSATTTTSTTATTTRQVRAANERWYPDHAILAGATKDSVKSMPEFKYN